MRERKFTFTPLILRSERLEEVVFEGGRFKLDRVVKEINRGEFRPDAIAYIGDQEFAIEFKVAHAVGTDKQSMVAAADLPMIEVDLNSVRYSSVSAEELDEAILHGADRAWIHHPDEANGQLRLDERVATDRLERGKRLKFHIERKPRGNVDYASHRESVDCLSAAGLLDQIGIPVECQHWFAVGLPIWQAAVLTTFVVAPAVKYSPDSPIKIRGDLPDYQNYANRLPSSMIRTDLAKYPRVRLEAAGYSTASFGKPEHAIFHYLAHLANKGVAVVWDNDEAAFFVAPELHGRLFRANELICKIRSVLRNAGAQDPDEVSARWMQKYNVQGLSPAAVARSGGEIYDALINRVDALAKMVVGYFQPIVVDDLCGLSLEPIRHKRIAEIAARKAKVAEEHENAALARKKILQEDAEQCLGKDAAAWLERVVPATNRSLVEWAGDAAVNLRRALSTLSEATRKRNARLALDEEVRGYQRQLETAARNAFHDEERAMHFIKAWRSECQNPSALRMVLQKLR